MALLDLLQRVSPPEPWAEGDNIPWHEPGFSARMLQEHLSQEHDAASRRQDKIDRQVDWIHREVLATRPSKILDLGCGPGFYASRLARLGHICTGIDFSPASIAYAVGQAEREGLDCRYVHQDIRSADYGAGRDLVMLLFGEFCVFRPDDARHLLVKAHQALAPGGLLLLEPMRYEAVRQVGVAEPTWYTSPNGLFSAQPHLCLQENFWDAQTARSTNRYFVIDATSAGMACYAASYQAYTTTQFRVLLGECGFTDVVFFPSLIGEDDPSQQEFNVVVARKPAG